ncbi:unnamed protein product, partial [Porites lobata]
KFLDLLESLGLEQHVTEATHIFGRTLDLVITRCVCKCNLTETLLGSTPRSFRYLSDHSAVRCSIRINKPAPQAKRVTYRNTKGTHPKSVDLDCLKQDIAKSDLCLQGCVGCPSS